MLTLVFGSTAPQTPMTAIELAADTLQVHLASERAQGFVEMLEELKVLKPADIEKPVPDH